MTNSLLHICVVIILISLSVGVECQKADNDRGDLVLVNILYRHGNRTPVDVYPTDPYRNVSYWPEGWGQLTNAGMASQYNLGKWIRQRYNGFLPLKYNRDNIHVQSTDVDRTLMSAYCNLAGLYEPDSSTNWNPNIKWRPIPVHTIPEKSDSVLATKKPCPKYNRLLNDLYKTNEFQKKLKDNNAIFEFVANATGEKMKTFFDIESIYNSLYIESLYNLTLPEWTKNFYPEPLKTIARFSFSVDCYTPQLARLKIGPLIHEMITNMENKISQKISKDMKIFMYSAHDETVGNLLQGLGCFNQLLPPYSSTVIMELTNKSANYFVSIFYRNSSLEDVHQLSIPGCDALCPLEKFVKLLEPVIPVDWEKECQLSLYEMVNDANGVWVMLYASVATFALIILSIAIRSYRKSHPQTSNFVYETLPAEAT